MENGIFGRTRNQHKSGNIYNKIVPIRMDFGNRCLCITYQRPNWTFSEDFIEFLLVVRKMDTLKEKELWTSISEFYSVN